jgi:hypothetical protein
LGIESSFETSTGKIKTLDPKNRKAVHDRMMKKQKIIDDAAIYHIMKALDTGVPLKDDPVYLSMLESYPFYQVKLEKRQKAIEAMRKLVKNVDNGEINTETMKT